MYGHYVNSAPMSSGTVIEFGPVLPPLDFAGNEIRENERGGGFGHVSRRRQIHAELWLANLKDHLKDICTDGKIILE